jgi:hypothetical protein
MGYEEPDKSTGMSESEALSRAREIIASWDAGWSSHGEYVELFAKMFADFDAVEFVELIPDDILNHLIEGARVFSDDPDMVICGAVLYDRSLSAEAIAEIQHQSRLQHVVVWRAVGRYFESVAYAVPRR